MSPGALLLLAFVASRKRPPKSVVVGMGAGNFWYVIGYRAKRGQPGVWGKPIWTDFSSAMQLMPLGSALLQWVGSGWQVLKP